MSPEEARQEAYNSTIAGGEEKVAIYLKKQFQNLALLYPDLAVPAAGEEGDKEYSRMARELIDSRQFTAPGRNGKPVTVTIDDLDKKDQEQNLGLRDALNVKSLNQVIPTREQLEATGNAVGNGVAAETGSIGFLGGATIMGALMGLLQWIMSGFAGGFGGLMQNIAGVTADNMSNSVAGNLQQLRSQRPDMEHILDDDAIAGAAQTTKNAVLAKAGVAVEGSETLATTVPATRDTNMLQAMNHQIRESILHPTGVDEKGNPKKGLADLIAGQLDAQTEAAKKDSGLIQTGYGLQVLSPTWWGAHDSKENKATGEAMAPIIAKTIADRVTDPNFRDPATGKKLSELNKDEFATVISNEVGNALAPHEGKFNFPVKHGFNNKNDAGKTYLEVWKDNIRTQVADKYEQLVPVIAATNNAPEMLARGNGMPELPEGTVTARGIQHSTDGNEMPTAAVIGARGNGRGAGAGRGRGEGRGGRGPNPTLPGEPA